MFDRLTVIIYLCGALFLSLAHSLDDRQSFEPADSGPHITARTQQFLDYPCHLVSDNFLHDATQIEAGIAPEEADDFGPRPAWGMLACAVIIVYYLLTNYEIVSFGGLDELLHAI